MKKIIALIILISNIASAQFYEVEYETFVSYINNEKGLEELMKTEPSVSERNKIIEGNANPPKEYFKFIFNEKEMEVKEGVKLATIEAIGVATDVKAPVSGILTEIFVADQSIVDYGKNLFEIEISE